LCRLAGWLFDSHREVLLREVSGGTLAGLAFEELPKPFL
jgi:hypothetical protein